MDRIKIQPFKVKGMQAAFDMALKTIIDQGGLSLDDAGQRCRYRGAQGKSCAFAALIKKEFRSHLVEDRSWDESLRGVAAQSPGITYGSHADWVDAVVEQQGFPSKFLTDLQIAHDSSKCMGCVDKVPKNTLAIFRTNMQDLALKYSLDYTPNVDTSWQS